MAIEWYFRKDGKEAGPIPSPQLKIFVREGIVLPDTPVCRVAGSEISSWVRAGEISLLFPDANLENLGPAICPKCAGALADGRCPSCEPPAPPEPRAVNEINEIGTSQLGMVLLTRVAAARLFACFVGGAGVFLTWEKVPLASDINGFNMLGGPPALFCFAALGTTTLFVRPGSGRMLRICAEFIVQLMALATTLVAGSEIVLRGYEISSIWFIDVPPGISITPDPGGIGIGRYLVLSAGLFLMFMPLIVAEEPSS